MNPSANPYKRHRFPSSIIQYAAWLYHRFNLSHRDIEDLLAERGIEVSYESVRLWCNRKLPRPVNSVMLDSPAENGISRATYFNWRSKYGGVTVNELKRMKELEAENSRLKRMYADLALENAAIKDVLSRKL